MIGKTSFVAVFTVYNTFHFLLLDVSNSSKTLNRTPDFSQDLRKTSYLKEEMSFRGSLKKDECVNSEKTEQVEHVFNLGALLFKPCC